MDYLDVVERARERVIETISQNMFLYGVTPSIGRLYGTLYFEETPMTLDDMKEELKMSKTSMSTSIRTLTDLNMVERVWKKGERKDLYEAKKDWYQIFVDFFANEWRKVTNLNVKAIKQSLKELTEVLNTNNALDEEEQMMVQKDIDKLNYALSYYQWLYRLFDFLESDELYDIIEQKESEEVQKED